MSDSIRYVAPFVMGILVVSYVAIQIHRITTARKARKVKAAAIIKPPQSPGNTSVEDPKARMDEILRQAVENARTANPMVGVTRGAEEINLNLKHWLNSEAGVHAPTWIATLGGLAGMACQVSVRVGYTPDRGSIIPLKGKDGKTYFVGDAINAPLCSKSYSVYAVIMGMAKHLGVEELPDVEAMFSRNAAAFGSDNYGKLELPENHKPGGDPLELALTFWPRLRHTRKVYGSKIEDWPVMCAVAIQEAMKECKDVLPPEIAASLAMQSAISVSQVDFMPRLIAEEQRFTEMEKSQQQNKVPGFS